MPPKENKMPSVMFGYNGQVISSMETLTIDADRLIEAEKEGRFGKLEFQSGTISGTLKNVELTGNFFELFDSNSRFTMVATGVKLPKRKENAEEQALEEKMDEKVFRRIYHRGLHDWILGRR